MFKANGNTFWYFPIEPYEERYSVYLSSPDGFWETFLDKNDVNYKALRPWLGQSRGLAGNGAVLDTVNRCVWAMKQVNMFLQALDKGFVKDGDVLYIEDFWHPGFEAIPYARSMYKVDFKIYAWLHAQSVDPSDFTAIQGMVPWMRYFEQGIAKSLDGIFVADAGLKEMLLNPPQPKGYTPFARNQKSWSHLPVDQCPIHAVGTCWDTEWVRRKYAYQLNRERSKIVVFASRWDKEKNPQFFMTLAAQVLAERDDVQFVVTTGFSELKSNDPNLVNEAKKLQQHLNHGEVAHFRIRTGVSKSEYMHLLNNSMIHFNCADHDWVSYALCESLAMGCIPLFPNHKSFPLALQFDLEHLYEHLNLQDAKQKLYKLLDNQWSDYFGEQYVLRTLQRFDNAIPYVANLMGITK